MKSFLMNKLLRDKVPDTMEKQGKIFKVRKLNDEEFITQLRLKLREEVEEFNEIESDNKDTIKDELADIYEVFSCLLKATGITQSEILLSVKHKKEKNGGFKKRIYVGKVGIQDSDTEWIRLYRKKGFKEIK